MLITVCIKDPFWPEGRPRPVSVPSGTVLGNGSRPLFEIRDQYGHRHAYQEIDRQDQAGRVRVHRVPADAVPRRPPRPGCVWPHEQRSPLTPAPLPTGLAALVWRWRGGVAARGLVCEVRFDCKQLPTSEWERWLGGDQSEKPVGIRTCVPWRLVADASACRPHTRHDSGWLDVHHRATADHVS
jgi:hypothetical protein